jgi:hypothetical protein
MPDATTFYDITRTIAKDFHVPDVLLPTSRCIFILESPHIQEVKHGVPVAGSSGSTMSKHIFAGPSAKIPLGLLMKARAQHMDIQPLLDVIGLMNICSIPLQKTAYRAMSGERESEDAVRKLAPWFEDMEVVRTGNRKDTYAIARQNEIQNSLVKDLRTKLHTFTGRSITFIPCGKFAQKFFRLADLQDDSWTVISDVPHPSYNSWDRERYAFQVTAVSRAVIEAAAEDKPVE